MNNGEEAIKNINKLIEESSPEVKELAKMTRHLGNGEVLLDLMTFIGAQDIETKEKFKPLLDALYNKYKPSWIK